MKGLRSVAVAVFAFALVAVTAVFWLGPDGRFHPLPHPKAPAAHKPLQPPEHRPAAGASGDADADAGGDAGVKPEGDAVQPPATVQQPHDGDDAHQQQPGDGDAHHGAQSPVSGSAFADFSVTDRPMMPTDDPLCTQLPGRNSSIVLIVKTGATEAFGKLPTQLQTILRCVPDLLLFSDMEQTVAGALVRDSLDTVLDSVKQSDEFGLYRAQQECLVSQGDCMRHSDKAKGGWAMDKYKNIHIAEKAYSLKPRRDWYVVIDADTFLFWTTLVAFLDRLDPSQKLLLGSIAHNKDFPFAHGGSGYVMSRAAMDDFVGNHPGIGNAYDERVMDECCGDWMLSKAVSETSGIAVTQAVSCCHAPPPKRLFLSPPWRALREVRVN